VSGARAGRDALRSLRVLAEAYGIQRRWRAADGTRRVVADDTLLALLRALGAPLDTVAEAPDALRAYEATRAATVVEPVAVQWGGDAPLTLDLRARAPRDLRVVVDLEDGTKAEWNAGDGALAPVPGDDGSATRVTLPVALPFGVHRLHVDAGTTSGDATVLAAPVRLAPRPRAWGVFAPMYALHDDGHVTGDLATFDRFARFAGAQGARVIGTLPLLATFYGAGNEPCDASPYTPVSRRHWNEVYIDLAAVPEVEPGTTFADPSPGALVDLPLLAREKRRVLERAAARLEQLPARRDQLARWLAQRPDVTAYARFRAAVERDGAGATPDPARDDASARYHEYAQWIVEIQLGELAAGLRERDQELYLDLPIGAHPLGFDVAAEPGSFARNVSVGAPPDAFFAGGQQWGFPPLLPQVARATGHRYLRECVDAHLRVAARLRIDHVMGLHRMWWVPEGAPAADGAYVAAPADEQYAVLTLAASRAAAGIIGENLGTVPPATNRALRRHDLLGMYVVQFEGSGRAPARRELACLDTHDTRTFARWWRDLDGDERAVLLDRLRLPGASDAATVLGALLASLGASRAEAVLASLEDLWCEVEAQNVPGTTPDERPNFRRRTARSLEEIEQSAAVRDLMQRLDRARATGKGTKR
jgi:4-alpha-glucanotransferase